MFSTPCWFHGRVVEALLVLLLRSWKLCSFNHLSCFGDEVCGGVGLRHLFKKGQMEFQDVDSCNAGLRARQLPTDSNVVLV